MDTLILAADLAQLTLADTSSPGILAVIVGLILMGAITAGARELVAKRKKRIAEEQFKAPAEAAGKWLMLLQTGLPDVEPKCRGMKLLQAAANALWFPPYETVTNRQIPNEAIPVYRDEVAKRRAKYPAMDNLQVVERLAKIFPKLHDEAVANLRQQVEAAKVAFERLCELDTAALDLVAGSAKATESEIKSKTAEFRRLNLQADGEARWEYVLATIRACQAVLRLGVQASSRSELGEPEDFIRLTVQHNKNLLQVKAEAVAEVLKELGKTDDDLMLWVFGVRLMNSPRWGAAPLLQGEYLQLPASDDACLTTHLLICKSIQETGFYTVPLIEVESVGAVRKDGERRFEIRLREGQPLYVPYANPPSLPAVRHAIAQSRTAQPTTSGPFLLTQSVAMSRADVARVDKVRLETPRPSPPVAARVVQVLGAPFYIFAWIWSQLTFAFLEGGCLFFTAIIVLPLLALGVAVLGACLVLPSMALESIRKGQVVAGLLWSLLWVVSLAGLFAVSFGMRKSYLSQNCGGSLRQMGRKGTLWLLAPAMAGLLFMPLGRTMWPGLLSLPKPAESFSGAPRIFGVFSLLTPDDWKGVDDPQVDALRKEVLNTGQQLSHQYGNAADTGKWDVPNLAAFRSRDGEVLLVAMMIAMPPQGESYLKEMYDSSHDKIRWGKETGRIKDSFINRLTEINGVPVHEIGIESQDGSRMLTYNFYSPLRPAQAAGITFVVKSGCYADHRATIEQIVQSLHVSDDGGSLQPRHR